MGKVVEEHMDMKSAKTVIFSPSGTTQKIVEVIVDELQITDTEIINITRHEDRKRQLSVDDNELLIIGIPVYSGRAQSIAIEWMQTIKANKTPTICIVVYGNKAFGDALREIKDAAMNIGCIPIACAAFIGEHSFSNIDTPIALGRPDRTDLNYAQSFGQKIRDKLLSMSYIDKITDINIPGNFPYRDKTTFPPVDFITVGACKKCGVCGRLCPVGAVDVENSDLIDLNKCIWCCSCIKRCPNNARKVKPSIVKDLGLKLSLVCQERKEPEIFL